MVSGIDVSHYQGVIDWPKAAESGVKFAYIKFTDGATWVDPKWMENRIAARSAGVKVGSYHFLRPGIAADQLDKFIAGLKADYTTDSTGKLVWHPDDLPPCLDVELPGSLPVLECAQRIAQELKRVAVIYTNPTIGGEAYLRQPELVSYPLWMAEYDVDKPRTITAWQTWTFWQHSDIGKVPGITRNVDLDWFNGDQAEFDRFLEESKALPT